MKYKGWDFSGYATRTNIRCSDGRTILNHAFDDCDGKKVPLVWNHQHNDSDNVLGHAFLEKRDDGMYAYGYLNHTDKAENMREQLANGDISGLSIYANRLRQSSKTPPCDVIHGVIQELSIVLAPANPGAYIENISLSHGEIVDDEAIIYAADYEEGLLYHARKDEDEDEEEKEEVKEDPNVEEEDEAEDENEEEEENKTPSKKRGLKFKKDKNGKIIGVETIAHSDFSEIMDFVSSYDVSNRTDFENSMLHADKEDDENDEESDGPTIEDVLKSMNDTQKAAVGMIIQQLSKKQSSEAAHSIDSDMEENTMKFNAFDQSTMGYYDGSCTLSHAEQADILKDAKKYGTLKAAVESKLENGEITLAHAQNDDGTTQTYGIADIDYLFPDARNLNTPPEFIKRKTDWVAKVMNGTHHTPFSRVKSMFADITEEEARAKGYIKGHLKREEVFTLLKRQTEPQTIYKKQKMDRDDIIDITDFDVVAWLKGEMRMMLEEEIARAILIGDGRANDSDDKIKEDRVRPIYNDADLFTVKVPVEVAADATDADIAVALMDASVRSRKLYKGSGNPLFFTAEDWLSEMLLMKDGIGHRFYKTEGEVATALRVREVVPVELMDNKQIAITTGSGAQAVTANYDLLAVMVNMGDYNIGADKGGATSFFEDFDIDYNQEKYLYETRMSGALVKPYSAISFYLKRLGA